VDTYFSKVNGNSLSASFKTLILKLFSYNPDERPSIAEIRNSEWMSDPSYNEEATRE